MTLEGADFLSRRGVPQAGGLVPRSSQQALALIGRLGWARTVWNITGQKDRENRPLADRA